MKVFNIIIEIIAYFTILVVAFLGIKFSLVSDYTNMLLCFILGFIMLIYARGISK
jgi:hypothetical protein